MTLGLKAALFRCAERLGTTDSGKLDDLERARPMGQAADEAALLERGDQAVDPRFRSQVESLLHFVEGRRYPRFLEAFVDEHQKLELLFGEHGSIPQSRVHGIGTKPKHL